MREPTVAAVMTTRVVAVTPDTTFQELANTLTGKRVSAVPVVDEAGRPIGVVSETDVIAKQEFHGGRDEPPHGDRAARDRWFRAKAMTAGEVMTTPVRAVRADEPLSAAARILAATCCGSTTSPRRSCASRSRTWSRRWAWRRAP